MYEFHDQFLLVDLFRVAPGKEANTAKILGNLNPDSQICKFIGTYDVAAFRVSPELTEIKFQDSYTDILDHTAFYCAHLQSSEMTETGQIPASESLPFYTLVTIQLRYLKQMDSRFDNMLQITSDILSAVESLDPTTKVTPLYGFGRSDLLFFIASNNFDSIFSILSRIRAEHCHHVVDTTTYACISYNHIFDSKLLKKLTSKIDVNIDLTCQPAYETEVLKQYPKELYKHEHILGFSDLRLASSDGIEVNGLVKSILDSRNANGRSQTLFSTSTSVTKLIDTGENNLTNPSVEISQALIEAKKNGSSLSNRRKDLLRSTFKLLDDLGDTQEVDNYLISQCRNLFFQLSACCTDEKLIYLTEEFDNTIEYEINCLLASLLDKIQTSKPHDAEEGHLARITYNLSVALSQRLENLDHKLFGLPEFPSYYGNGISTISSSLSSYIRQIYFNLDTAEIEGEWGGFIFFNQHQGFSLHAASVFSIPTQALNSVFGKALNWSTISHEVSHDIWQNENIFDKKLSYFHEMSLRDVVEGKASSLGFHATADKIQQIELHGYFWELYAHWFDYKHFYSSDIEFYLWTIWSSWSRLPIVRNDPVEYYTRAFAIYCSHNLSRFSSGAHNESEVNNLLNDMFQEMSDLLDRIEPVDYQRWGYKETVCLEREKIVNGIQNKTLTILEAFEYSLVNSKLVDMMDRNAPEIVRIANTIVEDKPLEHCFNLAALQLNLLDRVRQKKLEAGFLVEQKFLQCALLSDERNK